MKFVCPVCSAEIDCDNKDELFTKERIAIECPKCETMFQVETIVEPIVWDDEYSKMLDEMFEFNRVSLSRFCR